MREYIKFGFGFFIGYEIAKTLNEIAGESIKLFKQRLERGY